MIFGNESIATYSRSNVIIWMTLAFQAGVLNIGGFMACHRFVSHVTGFSTFAGYEVSQGFYTRALGMMSVPLLFLCGAIISGLLVDVRLKLHKKPKYYLIFGVMFLLILLVVIGGFNGAFGIFGEPIESRREGYALLALLCLICGMQNATVSTVSRAVVRTTHLTGLTTDLGIGIARVLNKARLGKIDEDIQANLMRVGIIFFFGLGSVGGSLLFLQAGFRGFLLPAFITGCLFGLTFYFQVLRSRPR